MSASRGRVLNLMPAPLDPGGIGTTLRTAWGVLRGSWELDARAFCYAPRGDGDEWRGDAAVTWTSSKAGAILSALRGDWRPGGVVVWHVGLLRLVPLFRLHKVPLALVLYGIEAWRRHDWLTRAVLRRVQHFYSISDYTWNRFRTFVRPSVAQRHRTLALGIAEPAAGPIPGPDTTPTVVMLSRLAHSEDYKGHREVIAAWPLVLRHVPAARLWILGDGDLRPDLERLAGQVGVRERVQFWGHVSEERKRELLTRARCLAMPSRGEGFGLVYAEAMRLGRPCLVSTSDAGQEVVNPPEAGLAARPDRPAELAEALARLLRSSSEWNAWSCAARARYERLYTAQHFEERLLAALRKDLGI